MFDETDCSSPKRSIRSGSNLSVGRVRPPVKCFPTAAALAVLAIVLGSIVIARTAVGISPPLLSAVVGCAATLFALRLSHPPVAGRVARWLARRAGRFAGGRLPFFVACRRDALLFRKLATLCRAGDLPYRQERVAALVGFMSRKAGLDHADQKLFAAASTLHRTGFVSLPPLPGMDHARSARLASDIAARLLAGPSRLHRVATEMACAHDESWDGGGTPCNLVGDAIPFPARLLQVALALDALLPRNGRQPDGAALTKIAARIAAESGRTLDPGLAVLPLRHVVKLEGLLASLPRPACEPPQHAAARERWRRAVRSAFSAPMLTLA